MAAARSHSVALNGHVIDARLVSALVIAKAAPDPRAKDAYCDYLKLAFENPKLAEPLNGKSIHDPKYRWFVAYVELVR